MGRFSAGFRTRALAGETPLFALEFTVGSTTKRFAKPPGIASDTQGLFKPRLLSASGVLTWSAYEYERSYSAPEFMAVFSDPDHELTKLFKGPDAREVPGSTVKAYLLYDDLDFADWFTVFIGVIGAVQYERRQVWAAEFRYDDFALSADTSDLFIPAVNTEDHPTADDDARGELWPICYGKLIHPTGAVVCPYVSTDGDEDDATKPHRYGVQVGYAQSIPKIYVGGSVSVASPSFGTDWFWTSRNGKSFTEVGFASAQTDQVTVDVHGLTTNGLGSTDVGDLITNKAKQIEHVLTNFVFQRWSSGAWFTPGTDSPLDTASITALEGYLDGLGQVVPDGSNALTLQSAFGVLSDWQEQCQVAVWWTEEGKLRFDVRSWQDSDVYLADNVPANAPWFRPGVHGRGPNPIYPVRSDGALMTDRVLYRTDWTPASGKFIDERLVRDFARAKSSGHTIDARWAKSANDGAPEFDAPSRRLRRLRQPRDTLVLNSTVAMMDDHLLKPMLVSDPDGPSGDGGGWGDDRVWKARLHSAVKRSLNIETMLLTSEVEPEYLYRAGFWDTGAGEVVGNKGRGVATFRRVNTVASVRSGNAWVENVDGKIQKIDDGITKRSPDGLLLEGASTNEIANSGFLDGFTGWTQTGTPTLQTTVKRFTDKTADDLGGTNQTANLGTAAGPTEDLLHRNTENALTANQKYTLTIECRDNTGGPVRVLIQSTTTSNYLLNATTWQAGATNVTTGWSATGGSWKRQQFVFTMEGTTSTVTVQVKSPGGVGNDSNIAHVQIEPLDGPSSVITGRNADGAVSRNTDDLGFQNDDSDRSFPWDSQGTFRCVWTPIITGATSGQRSVAIFRVDDGGANPLLQMQYVNADFDVGWSGGIDLSHRHVVLPDNDYKLILTWIGSNGELDEAQGTLIFDFYDPVAQTWSQVKGTGTQPGADATTRWWLGSLSGSSPHGWGYFNEVDVIPFVLTTEERRAFP